MEDKFSRLDVKAKTSNDEIINIEIQLKNEYNMIKEAYTTGQNYIQNS
ncbi:MAG: PD-(D/E)XK nuclease family transposase [Paeniclostridium sp.]